VTSKFEVCYFLNSVLNGIQNPIITLPDSVFIITGQHFGLRKPWIISQCRDTRQNVLINSGIDG